jgi:CheY-like chemotaxis protein
MAQIVIAEDCNIQRQLFAAVLHAAGHECRLAANGDQLLKELETAAPDLIVTDLFMPDRDGIEVIQALRRSGNTTPILAMSGGFHGSCEIYLRMAKALGANVLLPKPVSPQTLVDGVSEALTRRLRLVGN